MRTCISVIIALATSVAAYQVTAPTLANGWTVTGPNVLKWEQGGGDRMNFTAVLTNQVSLST